MNIVKNALVDTKLQFRFPFTKQEALIAIKIDKARTALRWGITNRCANGTYIVFLDYDTTPREWITEELLLLQERHHWLGEAHVFKTKNGYHAIFLEQHTLNNVYEVMLESSCDKYHMTIPMMHGRRAWVLRQNTKTPGKDDIQYVDTIPARTKKPTNIHCQSLAHKNYLQTNYQLPKTEWSEQCKNDNETELRIVMYHSRPSDEEEAVTT